MERSEEYRHEFQFTMPARSGEIYLTAESYAFNTVLTKCFESKQYFGSSFTLYGAPYVYIEVHQNKDPALDEADYVTHYDDYENTPILISNYEAGDQFSVIVDYIYEEGLPLDFTFAVYTKVEGVSVTDSLGFTSVLHMAVQEPARWRFNYDGSDVSSNQSMTYKNAFDSRGEFQGEVTVRDPYLAASLKQLEETAGSFGEFLLVLLFFKPELLLFWIWE